MLRARKNTQEKLGGHDYNTLPSAQALKHGLRPAQIICYGCYAALAALCMGFIFIPYQTFGILAGLIGIFGATIGLLRLAATFTPLPAEQKNDHTRLGGTNRAIDPWPFYTVLVPIYKEARIVPRLMKNLAAIDYPQNRIEIMMVCEADDIDTVKAVQRHLTPPFKIICAVPSLPRTKPKALNIALEQARGEIVTIYDAEDRPHPQQLKRAAQSLMSQPDLGAVQAPLDYYNISVNWLTRQFTLEYAFLYLTAYPRRSGRELASVAISTRALDERVFTNLACPYVAPFNAGRHHRNFAVFDGANHNRKRPFSGPHTCAFHAISLPHRSPKYFGL